MALYYFDFDDNETIFPDDEGTECPDLGAVKYEAIKALAEMTKDALPDGDHHKLAIVVRDEGGDLAFRASIVFGGGAGLIIVAILPGQPRLIHAPALGRVTIILSCDADGPAAAAG